MPSFNSLVRKHGIKIVQWIILGMLLVFPVSFFEGGDGGNWDSIDGGGSCSETGYPYRWKNTIYSGSRLIYLKYNYLNFILDGLILSLAAPFILEPLRYISKRLNLRRRRKILSKKKLQDLSHMYKLHQKH